MNIQNDVIGVKGTKTKYDRYIPISKPLKELLNGIEKNQDFCMYLIETGLKSAILESLLRPPAGMPDLRICAYTI